MRLRLVKRTKEVEYLSLHLNIPAILGLEHDSAAPKYCRPVEKHYSQPIVPPFEDKAFLFLVQPQENS